MKGLNLISSCQSILSSEPKTAFRLFTFEINLTDSGIKNYKKVLAIAFEYLRVVKDEWLTDGKGVDLFNECKLISKLSYDIYSVPEQLDSVCAIA